MLKHGLMVLALGAVLPFAAQAADPAMPARSDAPPELRLLPGGLVTEEDVGQLFAHLRAAMRAAAEGRDPPPVPEALARRLEAAGSELQLRGLLAGMALTHFVERAVRDVVRELAPPAPRDGI